MVDQNKSQAGVSRKILLVEDDPLLVNLYKQKFENEGYNLIIAEDGEKGLDLALKEEVDIVILDLMLPKLSGTELLTQMRQDPKRKDTPVIVLTNMSESEENKKVIDLGAKEYLIKADLTPTQLVDKINEYLTS